MTDPVDDLIPRANALIEMGRAKDTIPLLLRTLALNPDQIYARCYLAVAFMHINQRSEALRQVDAALATDTSDEWPHRLRAVLLGHQGQHAEALKSALEAARIQPASPEVLYTLATVYVELKQFPDAHRIAMQTLELAPNDANSHELLSFIAIRRGKFREAEKHARDSLRLNPENMDAMRFLAYALRGQRKRKEATQAWLEVVRRNPTEKSYRHELIETSSIDEWVRTVVTVTMIIAGLVLLGSFNDDRPTALEQTVQCIKFSLCQPSSAVETLSGSLPILRASCAIVLVMLPLAYVIWQRRFIQALPGVVQSLLKRRELIVQKLAAWQMLEVILRSATMGFTMFALFALIAALFSLLGDHAELINDLGYSVTFALFAFGIRWISLWLFRQKSIFKNQLD